MSGQWLTRQTEDDTVHAVPLVDAIVHEHAADCPCGPTVLPSRMPRGTTGQVLIHHSRDGRERGDPEQSGGSS